jgi:hypothetical protein
MDHGFIRVDKNGLGISMIKYKFNIQVERGRW